MKKVEEHQEEELDEYFIKLVDCILRGFDTLGYPPCEGNVVSSNKQWRKSLYKYIQMMTRMVSGIRIGKMFVICSSWLICGVSTVS